MYSTVSIRLSHRENPTELCIKKFFFRWSSHFCAFELPNKNPPKTGTGHFNGPKPFPSSPETSLGDTRTQLLMTNFLSLNPSQCKSNNHKQGLLITKNKISYCVFQLQIIKS